MVSPSQLFSRRLMQSRSSEKWRRPNRSLQGEPTWRPRNNIVQTTHRFFYNFVNQ